MAQEGLKFTREHEWFRPSDGAVGITDHAQDQLGDITFVELPDEGGEVDQGEAIAVIESAKAAADIYAPVGGRIVDVNRDVEEAPEKINEDPYGAGWIFKIESAEPREVANLMSAAAYDDFLKTEADD